MRGFGFESLGSKAALTWWQFRRNSGHLRKRPGGACGGMRHVESGGGGLLGAVGFSIGAQNSDVDILEFLASARWNRSPGEVREATAKPELRPSTSETKADISEAVGGGGASGLRLGLAAICFSVAHQSVGGGGKSS